MNTVHLQPPRPTSWATEQRWRHVYSWEPPQAIDLRLALFQAGCYLTRDVASDPAFAVLEANDRAALADVLPLLSRNDLHALFQVARLLYLIPANAATWAALDRLNHLA